jgi:hypothetical protein
VLLALEPDDVPPGACVEIPVVDELPEEDDEVGSSWVSVGEVIGEGGLGWVCVGVVWTGAGCPLGAGGK